MRAEVHPACPQVFSIIKPSLQHAVERVAWTKLMDENLAKLAEEHHTRHWDAISGSMKMRFANPCLTAKKCRERWSSCVNPDIRKLSLTDAESLMLVICHESIQNRWSRMAKRMPRRYSSTLKNNFYSLIRCVLRRITRHEFRKVSALSFLQSIYVCFVMVQLSLRPADLRPKRGAVPSHIQQLVTDNAVTKAQCEEHLSALVKCLLNSNQDRPKLATLATFTTMSSLYDLFHRVSVPLEAKFSPWIGTNSIIHSTEYVEEAILSELERAVNPTVVPVAANNPLPGQEWKPASSQCACGPSLSFIPDPRSRPYVPQQQPESFSAGRLAGPISAFCFPQQSAVYPPVPRVQFACMSYYCVDRITGQMSMMVPVPARIVQAPAVYANVLVGGFRPQAAAVQF